MDQNPVLELQDVSKHFGGLTAVDRVSFKVFAKEIVAIVGDNGAGKSTIIKTISGVYRRDGGRMLFCGEPVEFHSTLEARRKGVETVYQEEGLIPQFDASLNLFLGRPLVRNTLLGRWLRIADYKTMRMETQKLLGSVGIDLPNLRRPVTGLSGGQRQSVLVGKAIYWGGRLLIFDEPTNHLGARQESNIMSLIKRIREQYEVAIIIISHNIAHVFEMADRIIVLRNGSIVGERSRGTTTPNEIVSMITGLSS